MNGDGAVTQDDRDIIWALQGKTIADAEYRAEADLNRDGVINNTDYTMSATLHAALGVGRLSMQGNIVGYSGYLYNVERPGAGHYHVRFRVYDPALGRWLTRDPAGYVDGMNLYEYVQGDEKGV